MPELQERGAYTGDTLREPLALQPTALDVTGRDAADPGRLRH